MARYGFDRNEVLITKTTLIDKDGFIFETDKPYSTDPSDYDVIFIDYDGTVPYTYMADDFLAMKKFPPDPQHEGLISRGWNWDFDEAQAYVRKYGALVIGETYSPADGATQITINISNRLHVPITFQQSVDKGVEIDWGDKSSHEYVSGTGVVTASHDYAEPGEYVLRLKAKDGCELGFGDPENKLKFFNGYFGEGYTNDGNEMVHKLILSDNVKTFWQYAFAFCPSLDFLSLPNSIEAITNDSISAGFSPYKIKNIIIPKNVTRIEGLGGTDNLEYISFSNSVEDLPGWFMSSTCQLKVLTLPEKITSINVKDNLYVSFSSCNNAKIIIIPDNVTTIPNNLFAECRNLERLYISNGITAIGDKCFTRLYNLVMLHLPDHLVSIGTDCFSWTWKLSELTFPETLETIGKSSFNSIGSIEKLILPDSCTSIGDSVFASAQRVKYFKLSESIQTLTSCNMFTSLEQIIIPASVTTINSFMVNASMLYDAVFKSTTPPTFERLGAFTNSPPDLRIWVPYSADHSVLNAYKAVSALSSRADHIYELNEDGSIPDNI